jgi:hypothetical protein
MLTEADFDRQAAPAAGGFFSEAVPTQAYAKVGLVGGQGDGKTFTAVEIAIGLHKLCKARGLPEGNKPIAFLESSEFGLDFHVARIEAETGFKPLHRKTKAFKDLLDAFRIAGRDGLILVVDTISGYAEELQNAYRALVGRESLTLEDMGVIGRQWAEAMEDFKDGPFHCILSGRVAYEWGHFENESTGRRDLERTNIKVKGIGDVGYECSLLVNMKKQADMSDNAHPRIFRVATVLKDKSLQIDGVSFDNPTFAHFLPHFNALAIGGVHRPAASESSVTILRDPRTGRNQWEEKQIRVDEIESLMAHFVPGQDSAAKQRRSGLLQSHFGTLSKERLATLHLEVLTRGYTTLHIELAGYPPVTPTRSANWEPPAIAPPGSVAMVAGPGGKMMPLADANAAKAAGNGAAVHAPTAPAEASPPIAVGESATAPAPAGLPDVTPGPTVKRRGGRPKGSKNKPADAPAPDLFPGGDNRIAESGDNAPKPNAENPAAQRADVPGAVEEYAGRHRPDANPPAPASDAKTPPPGSTNPNEVLAGAVAPPEPAPAPKRRGRPPGSKNKDKDQTADAGGPAADGAASGPEPAVGDTATAETGMNPNPDAPAPADAAPAPRRRGRPPGSKNKPAETPAPAAPAAPASPASDPGTFAGFSVLAPKAAAEHGIQTPQFVRGMNATLQRARLLSTPREQLPREFLLDFYDAIQHGRWNAETGEFAGAAAPAPAAS